MPAIDRTKLEKAAPKPRDPAKAVIWDNYLTALCGDKATAIFATYKISDKPLRLMMCFANLLQETGAFTIIRENMSYSAERLMVVWPDWFEIARICEPIRAPA